MTTLNYSVFTFVNLGPGASRVYPDVNGDWLFTDGLSNSGCKIAFDDETPQTIRRRTLIRRPFGGFVITNLSATANLNGTIIVGVGDPPEFPGVDSYVGNLLDLADNVVAAGAQLGLLVSQPYGRRTLLSIPETEAGGLRVGGSTVSGTHGLYLPKGVVLQLNASNAVYVFNPNGVGVTVTMGIEEYSRVV